MLVVCGVDDTNHYDAVNNSFVYGCFYVFYFKPHFTVYRGFYCICDS